MLTLQKINDLVNNKVVDMYTKLNQDLTNEVIKSIKQAGDISSYTKHQLQVLIKNGGNKIFNDTLMKTQRLTSKRKKEVSNIFNDLVKEEYKGYEPIYERKGIEYEISPEANQIIDSVISATNNELKNMTRTIAFSNKKQYVSAMDELYKRVISGGWSYDRAIKSTILDLVDKGITLTKDGREYRLESMVKMNLFNSLGKTAQEISKNIGDELKLDYVWIGITPHCRPTHIPINGVKMKRTTFERDYEYLTEEYNCYHKPLVSYVDKEFEPLYKKEEIAKINSNAEEKYKDRQKQNYYARQVREKKKDIASLGSSEKDLLENKMKQLRNAQIKYRTFSKSKGLEVDYSQTWEAGYNGNRNR